jgi:N-methylhydantoinase A
VNRGLVKRGRNGFEQARKNFRVGIDIGGTFTDFCLFDSASGVTLHHKVPSSPANPDQAMLAGLDELLAAADVKISALGFIGLGTTVATNTLLERSGAEAALVTTAGFRDLIEIGRQTRPSVFDLRKVRPVPLIPRYRRLTVSERVSPTGEILKKPARHEIDDMIEELHSLRVDSVAVCFLNSYANPANERLIANAIRDSIPDLHVCTSYEVTSEYREYERFVSTVINSYLAPRMSHYIQSFQEKIKRIGFAKTPYVMSSGGGILPPEHAAQRPIDTLLSGPSGGVSGAIALAGELGMRDIITLDMGGTSTEVCVVRDCVAKMNHLRSVDGFPIRAAALDIHTIGSGGSSVAWIDPGGMLRVGPQSVGADPGPACYGRGGDLPTVTDASVALGRLNPTHLLGGGLEIDKKRAERAIDGIAEARGVSRIDAAAAILSIADHSIAQAIRFVTVQRGIDPSEFTLVAFGGAGPLHASFVAKELGMPVLVPERPGILCAYGVLTKDIQRTVSRTRILLSSHPGASETMRKVFEELERELARDLHSQAGSGAELRLERRVDARYKGQNFELSVLCPHELKGGALDHVHRSFDAAHEQAYGYHWPKRDIELVTFRVTGWIQVDKPVSAASRSDSILSANPKTHRPVYFDSVEAFVNCPIFDRTGLSANQRVLGPAVIEQADATTLVPPGFMTSVDPYRNMRISYVADQMN